jgi:hypothetical protein
VEGASTAQLAPLRLPGCVILAWHRRSRLCWAAILKFLEAAAFVLYAPAYMIPGGYELSEPWYRPESAPMPLARTSGANTSLRRRQ